MPFILRTAGPDEMFVRGEGSWLIDRAGRRFLDARSGIANMILGYSRHDIAEAMHRQALELPFVCTMRYERPAPVIIDYARALVDVAPAGLTRVRFTHTGSSAVESALLMARRYHRNLGRSGRTIVVGLQDGYHGSTLMTMAAGGWPMLHEAFAPMPEGFQHLPPDAQALGEVDADQTAAIIVEPVKGFSGVALPSEFLTALRAFCDEHDILLIYDEVFTGLGRMGPMFATGVSGVPPDIMCLSKTLTAGYAALGAVLTNDKVYDSFNEQTFAHASSTDAHPISCAAGLAALTALTKEGALALGTRMGRRLGSALTGALGGSPRVREVRTMGAFVGIDVTAPPDFMAMMQMKRHLQAECERRGVLVDYTPQILMLVPPYTLSDEDADLLAETVSWVLLDFKEGDVDAANLRPPSGSGRR